MLGRATVKAVPTAWMAVAAMFGSGSVAALDQATMVQPDDTWIPLGVAVTLGVGAVVAAYKAGTVTKDYSARLTVVERDVKEIKETVKRLEDRAHGG